MKSRFSLSCTKGVKRIVDEPKAKTKGKKKRLPNYTATRPQIPVKINENDMLLPSPKPYRNESLSETEQPNEKELHMLVSDEGASNATQSAHESPKKVETAKERRERVISEYNSVADEYEKTIKQREQLNTSLKEINSKLSSAYKQQMQEEKPKQFRFGVDSMAPDVIEPSGEEESQPSETGLPADFA